MVECGCTDPQHREDMQCYLQWAAGMYQEEEDMAQIIDNFLSTDGVTVYNVVAAFNGMLYCECKGWQYRRTCSHIDAVRSRHPVEHNEVAIGITGGLGDLQFEEAPAANVLMGGMLGNVGGPLNMTIVYDRGLFTETEHKRIGLVGDKWQYLEVQPST